jgi:transposase InsO family protein
MKGYKYTIGDGVMKVTKGSIVVIKDELKAEKLYVLWGISGFANVVAASDPETTKIWHMRLGHMSALGLAELSKRGLLDGCHADTLDFYEHCVFGKHKRVKFSSAVHNTKNILDYVHADLWGPSRITSHGGARYILTIIDDKSRRVWPYFLKQKSDAFESFKVWKTMVEKQTERKLKVLRIDNGMEFCSGDFNSFCRKDGIVRHDTIQYMPQQNGVAERMNRTIISKARCMLSNSSLSQKFWTKAASTACHLINCSPSTAIDKKTPLEVWSSSPYDYSQLRVFGCTAYAHVDNGKLEPRAIKGVFYDGSGVKAYKLWNPDTQKAFYSRNILFNESAMFISVVSTNATNQNSESISVQVEHVGDVDNHASPSTEPAEDLSPISASSPVMESHPQSLAEGWARRKIVWPRRLIQECNIAFALAIAEEIDNVQEPLNYSEAILSTDSGKWIGTMHEEMESLEK